MTLAHLKKARVLNKNALKLIAAAAMLVDHFGLIFFPTVLWLRMIGRLAMPIFAFCIAEGCRYTKNKVRYFSMLFGLGAACQLVFYFFAPDTLYFGILLSFSLSVLIVFTLQFAKKVLFAKERKAWQKTFAWLPFVSLVAGAYVFCHFFEVDYGFYGCMVPVFASLFDFHRIPAHEKLKKMDVLPLRVLCISVPLIMLIVLRGWASLVGYALFSLPILLLYNGERGTKKMKYFFYIFYPVHLGLLEGIYILIYLLQ